MPEAVTEPPFDVVDDKSRRTRESRRLSGTPSDSSHRTSEAILECTGACPRSRTKIGKRDALLACIGFAAPITTIVVDQAPHISSASSHQRYIRTGHRSWSPARLCSAARMKGIQLMGTIPARLPSVTVPRPSTDEPTLARCASHSPNELHWDLRRRACLRQKQRAEAPRDRRAFLDLNGKRSRCTCRADASRRLACRTRQSDA